MEAKIEVEVLPFEVPCRVEIKISPDNNASYIPLSRLEPYVLEKLCAYFRERVFEKAGKQFPPEKV